MLELEVDPDELVLLEELLLPVLLLPVLLLVELELLDDRLPRLLETIF